MNPEGRKLIFLDIDGTLSSNALGCIPLSARRACRRARENGHLLCIATGRARVQVGAKVLALGFDGLISSGGACVEAGGVVISRDFLPRSLVERLLKFFDERRAGYIVEMPERIIVSPDFSFSFEKTADPLARALKSIAFLPVRRFFRRMAKAGNGDFDREKVPKLVFLESEQMRFDDVAGEFGGECEIFRNSIPVPGMQGGEVSAKGVHKGSAAEKAARFYGIRREDTMAFGDSDNDRMMIEYAGVGIAMENGDERLKAAADDITASVNRGGIAKAFKKYGLI